MLTYEDLLYDQSNVKTSAKDIDMELWQGYREHTDPCLHGCGFGAPVEVAAGGAASTKCSIGYSKCTTGASAVGAARVVIARTNPREA